jgi:hypothetical protein
MASKSGAEVECVYTTDLKNGSTLILPIAPGSLSNDSWSLVKSISSSMPPLLAAAAVHALLELQRENKNNNAAEALSNYV